MELFIEMGAWRGVGFERWNHKMVLDTLGLSCLRDTQCRQSDAQAWGSGGRSGLEMWSQESLARDGYSTHGSA